MTVTPAANMQQFQEFTYAGGYDYRRGSPHLKHPQLYTWFTSLLRQEVRQMYAAGLPPTVLEIGAGDGSFVEPLLAAGARVTATEMSRPSVELLRERFGINPSFKVAFDSDGTMSNLDSERYAIVLYASVLHHIPDYLSSIAAVCDRHLLSGGTVIALQDPLWYASLPRGVHLASEAMYLSWRITCGDLLKGFASRRRRMRDDLRADEPGDMVEYHVVREGVDQAAISRLLEGRFANVDVTRYWSTQATVWQHVGQRLGLRNTFAVRAVDHRGV